MINSKRVAADHIGLCTHIMFILIRTDEQMTATSSEIRFDCRACF